MMNTRNVVMMTLAMAFSVSAQNATEITGGISNFPGMASMTDMIQNGGFAKQLASGDSCEVDNPLSPECMAALADYPATFARLLNLNFDGVDLDGMCTHCQAEDVITYIDNIRAQYKDEDKDSTCDGSMAEEISHGAFYDLLKILITSSCVKNPDGARCWSDILPQTTEQVGLAETMGSIDFDDMGPATLTSLMTQFDPIATCSALRDGGCCSSMMLDIMTGLVKLTCLDTPLISSALSATSAICPGLEPACSGFTMPPYSAPGGCPEFQAWIDKLNGLKLPSDSKYSGCTLQGCPKNDCELFICSPAAA